MTSSSIESNIPLLRETDSDVSERNENQVHLSGNWKAPFHFITFIISISLLIKCPLFITRQIVPLLKLCPERNASLPEVEQEYIFTMVAYNTLFIGRFAEFLVLQIHIYKFFKDCTAMEVSELKQLCVKGLHRKRWITISFVVLSIYMLVHSLSIPALGITLEIKSGKGSKCEPYVYEYHAVYWILDIIRYMYDVVIRLFMVLTTMAVAVIWSEDIGLSEDTDMYQEEPTNIMEYLEDREIICKDHSARWQDYVQRGERVEKILRIFQTWFILPWILFFIGSSLDTDHILLSWKQGPSGDGQYDFSKMAYLVYNFNQLFLLTLPYLCTRIMNAHHHEYASKSREQQLETQKTASRMAFAYLNKIEQQDHFNFVPCIGGTSIKIQVENPLYTVFLLLGFFFAITEALI